MVTPEHVCLLLGHEPPTWFRAALGRLEDRTDAGVALVVRTDTRGEVPDTPLDLPVDAETVHTRTHPTDRGVRLPRGIVDRIAAESDLVVQSGHATLTGAVLDATPGGVLAYHHDDRQPQRGPLARLSPRSQNDQAGVTVRRLTPSPAADRVVTGTTVDLSGTRTWDERRERVHWAGVPLLADAVAELRDPSSEPISLPVAPVAEARATDDTGDWPVASYALADLVGAVAGIVENCATLRRSGPEDD